ncbi:hypothetical protein ELI02_28225 (plasmid) [Rhizobium leguminosarum]|uniref:hypothetical protein n=1 Tax=Rhizobium leguminosarum TaxID=384 RepID=UPI0010318F82|nr:hypothetical protein [Rhizobium leguminosarum]TAV41588.1 hypothetical protein ELI29_33805 [Rhizobium leguminosarum]TAX02015.1 hypothetical protein ELI07_33075 [Rhizobium leguminosarum]TAX22809.1 hypothetical protein ELI04_32980 [Rhizobium leguminosarum]TAX45643.1 hypothetical protein ELI02_28225 [Rhizobium leguminosarum]TAX46639.1 hypothetical protein ELI01_31335 [Rhizobium leguminosarum]
MVAAISQKQRSDLRGADHDCFLLAGEQPPKRPTACHSRVPIGLERSLDLDEERDLDRELQTELAFAEDVTDHLAEDADPTAGGGEELSEPFHGIFSFRNADIAGISRMTYKEGRT